MPRAPRTRLLDAYAQLAQANALRAQREAQARAERDARRINKGRLLGAVAGAGLAVATGGASLPVIAAGANVGGQIGAASQGGQIDPVALSGSALMAFDAMERASTVESERELLRGITPSPAVRLQTAGVSVPAEGAIPGLGGAPLPPNLVEPDAATRLLTAAQRSSTPLHTAAGGLSLLRAVQPPPREPKITTAKSGEWVFSDGRLQGRLPPDEEKAKEFKPTNYSINEGTPEIPKWRLQLVTTEKQRDQLFEGFAPDRIRIGVPPTEREERSTQEERDRQLYIDIGLAQARGEEVSAEDVLARNLAGQRLQRPVSWYDPINGPQSQPGMNLKVLDDYIAGQAGKRPPPAEGPAAGAEEQDAPPAAGQAPPLPVPEPERSQGGLTPAQRSKVQEQVRNAIESRARTESMLGKFKPEYQTYLGKLGAWAAAGVEKMGVTLPQGARQYLAEYTAFRVDALSNLNQYIHDLTGAQLSQFEADRLRRALADPDNMSPTEFLAAAGAVMDAGARAQARYAGLLKDGTIKEGDPITDDLARQYPLTSKRDRRKEWGLEG